MSELGFDADQQKIIDKVEKLLRLAARNTNPEEAAAATAKAQELLAAYNLSMSDVSQSEDKSAVREQLRIKGGMYEYQRELYGAVARLNFCLYWTIVDKKYQTKNKLDRNTGVIRPRYVLTKTFQHVIIGRLVNARSTRIMADYLRQTIERLVNERYSNQQRWMAEAVAYREGISDAVCERIEARRYDARRKEELKRKEAQARSGVSTSQALTLAAYAEQERDANTDFIMGEGWSAKQAAERAERARLAEEAERAHTAWAEANPEEARKLAEEQRKAARSRRYGGGPGSRGGQTSRERRQGQGSYWQGVDVGKSVSIDPQVSDRPANAPARIGRG